MNTYFAVSLNLYNKKEYIIYSIGGKEITKVRELGELLFDFADQMDKPERFDKDYFDALNICDRKLNCRKFCDNCTNYLNR